MSSTSAAHADFQERCAVCSSAAQPRIVYTVAGIPIGRCPDCGVGRALVPDSFNPLDIYEESYFQGGMADGYADYQGSQDILRAEFRSALEHLTSVGVPRGRLIEIGSAYGFFLDEASKQFDVSGVEVADAAAAASRARGHDVVSGVVTEEVLASRGPFDAFVMLDVIEHIARPDELIELLSRHARPGAALMVSTGDWNSLFSRAMGKRWRLMTPPQHLWFFTGSTLRTLLRRFGFEVLDIQYPWKSVPVDLVAYQLARSIGAHSLVRKLPIPKLGIPINCFDAMRIVARYRQT